MDLEKYTQEVVKDKPIILWNLELDTLRADLGASTTMCCLLKHWLSPGAASRCYAGVGLQPQSTCSVAAKSPAD